MIPVCVSEWIHRQDAEVGEEPLHSLVILNFHDSMSNDLLLNLTKKLQS